METIGQYFASIVIGLYAFIKGIQKGYNALKDFFIKKEQKQESKVTVNVGSTITPSSDFKASKEDYRYFLYFLLEQGKIKSPCPFRSPASMLGKTNILELKRI